MASIIQRLSGPMTDVTRPKMYRDPVINPGTLALFDFLDPYCNPAADGDIAVGAAFKNLVDGNPAAVAEKNATAGILTNAAGKAGLVFSGGGGAGMTRINLGLSDLYNLDRTQNEFIFCAWYKEPTVGFSTGQATVAGKQAAPNNAIYNINVGNGGIPQSILAGQAVNVFGASNAGIGAPRHVAAHWRNGLQRLFVNGVLTFTRTIAAALPDHSAFPLTIGTSNTKMTFYRLLLEDVVASGADPTAQILADYARGVAKKYV